jgi:uncharacterized phiE125 gp8 family phage protein
MALKLIEKSEENFIELPVAKSYLRIHHDLEDELLNRLIHAATTWVEESTGKTLTPKTWQYTHNNSRFFLPNPPVLEILEVKLKGKKLNPDQYTVTHAHGRTSIEVPFTWQKNSLCVTYKTGYGPALKDIPPTLYQAVLTTLAYLYENRSPQGTEAPSTTVTPWIQYHRYYHMV